MMFNNYYEPLDEYDDEKKHFEPLYQKVRAEILKSKNVNVIRKDKSGITKLMISKNIATSMERNAYHLCFNCSNAYCHKCMKIYDIKKKTLDNYSFVETGFQIVTANNDIYSFFVEDCKNYNPDNHKDDDKKKELKYIKNEKVKLLWKQGKRQQR